MSNNLGQCELSLPLSHSAVVIAAAALPAVCLPKGEHYGRFWERKHPADEREENGGV